MPLPKDKDKDAARNDPRRTRLVELRERITELDRCILELADRGERQQLTPEEDLRWEELTTERDTVFPEYQKLESREARLAEIRNTTLRRISGLPDAKRPVEELWGMDVRALDWRQARDGAVAMLEDRDASSVLSESQKVMIDRMVRDPRRTELARRIVVTENDHYKSGFYKAMTRVNPIFTDDERTAMLRYEEYRTASETSAAGGYAIPVFIDPSVILTDQETDNPFLAYARTVDVNTNAWRGISSGGVAWSFDSEGTAVSDDSLTSLSQPEVTVFTARGFIPYSIEIEQDWPGFQAEMGRLLGFGYDELLVDKFSRGSGLTEPRGILTALAANGTVQVNSTTDGTFGYADVYNTWKALPQKYRRRASWMMSVGINNAIRQFGAANVYHAATVALPAGAAEVLFNRPVLESPYFPDFTGTTGAESRLVVGDFSNYVIARRQGMNVELVPQLFDVTNNRPTGERGWFAYARIGGNSVNDAGFRLLCNT